ncbi:MAG: hypothetical protein KA715_02440 [Xanthomonadaceae bacterium]|nr:hypothetical protein [Xanthomonadaceae bacterium]
MDKLNWITFFAWWLSLLGYGYTFVKKRDSSPLSVFEALLYGSAWYSLLGWIFFIIGPISSLREVAWGFVLIGLGLLSQIEKKPRLTFKPKWYWFPGLWVGSRILSGFEINSHGDPYTAYLAAFGDWFFHGGYTSWSNNQVYFLTGSWDVLNVWGFLFGRGLPTTEITNSIHFGQWVSASVATLGIALFPFAWNQKLDLKLDLKVLTAMSLVALSSPILGWMQPIAKSDTGGIFWALGAALFVGSQTKEDSFKVALYAGLTSVAKITYAPFGVILLLAHVFMIRLRSPVEILAGGMTAVLPKFGIWILLTGNPLFPFLNSFFKPTTTLSYWAKYLLVNPQSQKVNFDSVMLYLSEIFSEHLGLVYIALIGFFLKTSSKNYRIVMIAACIATVVFMGVLRPSSEIRYLGPPLTLLAIEGIRILSDFLKHRFWKTGVLLVVIATSNIPVFIFYQFILGSPKFSQAANDWFMNTRKPHHGWIRKNVSNTKIIGFISDPEIFSLIDYQTVSIVHSAMTAETLDSIKEVRDWKRVFAVSKIDFLLADFDHPGRHPYPLESQLVAKLKSINCTQFRLDNKWVWDVSCLIKSGI